MKHKYWYLIPAVILLGVLPGCGMVGQKAASMSEAYGAAAVLSLIMLIAYCAVVRKKEVWFLLLFTSVLVVNSGYFALAISRSLEEALLANRIAYLGSVFLPMAMLMIILKVTKIGYRKSLPGVLLGIGLGVFLVAASPGYLDIYYKEVTFARVNGVAVLSKVYGPWHRLYLFYLLGYFTVTVCAVIYAAVKGKMGAISHAVTLSIAVFVNIGVWLIEQLVQIDFEILSISYIISEMFLLGLQMLLQENERLLEMVSVQQTAVQPEPVCGEASAAAEEKPPLQQTACADLESFCAGLASLTKTERAVFDRYIAGKSTKEIMAELNIKENTLKFHNKNLYGKLGVSSRKQLLETSRQLRSGKETAKNNLSD